MGSDRYPGGPSRDEGGRAMTSLASSLAQCSIVVPIYLTTKVWCLKTKNKKTTYFHHSGMCAYFFQGLSFDICMFLPDNIFLYSCFSTRSVSSKCSQKTPTDPPQINQRE